MVRKLCFRKRGDHYPVSKREYDLRSSYQDPYDLITELYKIQRLNKELAGLRGNVEERKEIDEDKTKKLRPLKRAESPLRRKIEEQKGEISEDTTNQLREMVRGSLLERQKKRLTSSFPGRQALAESSSNILLKKHPGKSKLCNEVSLVSDFPQKENEGITPVQIQAKPDSNPNPVCSTPRELPRTPSLQPELEDSQG